MRRAGIILTIAALSAASLLSCGGGDGGGISPEVAEILEHKEQVNPYDIAGDSAPDGGCTRLRTFGPRQPLGRVFNDSNHVHLRYARAGGIVPVHDAASAWRQGAGLVRVHSDSTLLIDELKHSYPYLRPHAAALLQEISKRFRQKLHERGGGKYRIKVTSLLRTDATVGRLRRVNRNASGESAHSFGTTFDISYSKFICDDASDTRRTFDDLKNLLAEVVAELRDEGRCVVKHERRQACLHITAIDTDSL